MYEQDNFDNWIAIKERHPIVPKDEKFISVLVYTRTTPVDGYISVRHYENSFGKKDTHWMPLPQIPYTYLSESKQSV